MASSRKRLLPDLSLRVEACLTRYLSPSGPTRFCVGFSGGLDSVVLLHILATFCKQSGHVLRAVHVHHGLSPHADDWAQFACRFAAGLGVECEAVRVAVRLRDELGLEAAARLARYAVFEQQDCDVLLLAQHRDDQAETLLLNLLRGAGVRGLAAMPESRSLTRGACLVRPFLDISRSELLAYALAQQLTWVEDESNADQALRRNFLRHAVMPILSTEFSGLAATLSRSARHLEEADALLLELAQQDLRDWLAEEYALDLAAAEVLSPARFRNMLRYWLQQAGIVPDTRAFDELTRMMLVSRSDAQPCWIWREHAVRRYRNLLHVTKSQVQAGPPHAFVWQGESVMPIPSWHGYLCWQKAMGDMGLASDVLKQALVLRPREGGERMRLRPAGPTRLLKHLYQEAGAPPWRRESLPLLWIGDRLAAVPGLWVAAEFAQHGGWKVSWREGA